MLGGSAQARKENVSVSLTDAGGRIFDLQALGLVRSVFNLRADGRAVGQHYSPYVDSYISWDSGHEPLQTVLVTDLPASATPGQATLTFALIGLNDNSSGTGNGPFTMSLEIIPGSGNVEQFIRQHFGTEVPVDFSQLETAPYSKISFGPESIGSGATKIGAASITIGFDNNVVNSKDLNLYVPESTVRDPYVNPAVFGETQRMVYWHQDGQKLYVDIIAPQGIYPGFLQLYVVHPPGLTGSPAFNILSAQVYGTDGNSVAITPSLTYSP
jgi:hypothetical protein